MTTNSDLSRWKLVPPTMTLAMYRAFMKATNNKCVDYGFNDAYQSMLAAAPVPPRARRVEAGEAVAWLHTVTHKGMDGETDLALSFSPDNFPLMGEGSGYMPIAHEPLDTRAAPADVDGDPHAIAEQFIQAEIDRAPEPLRRLGEFLSRTLDEDQWATANAMLLGIATANSAEGKVVVTKDETGNIVAVTRQDDDGRIIEVIAEGVPVKPWKDPTGFSVAGILDEANNWTRRETGRQMILNYAAMLNATASKGDN